MTKRGRVTRKSVVQRRGGSRAGSVARVTFCEVISLIPGTKIREEGKKEGRTQAKD